MERIISRASARLILFCLVLLGSSCDRDQPASLELLEKTQPVSAEPQRGRADRLPSQTPTAGERLIEENWFGLYMGEAKIGHTYNRVFSVKRNGEPLVRIEVEQQISLMRGSDPIEQSIHLVSLERPDGEVVALDSQIGDGNSVLKTEAVPRDGRLEIKLHTGDTVTRTIEWKPTSRGFYAEHQVLREMQRTPGQVVTYWTLVPVLNVLGETRLTVRDWEEVDTPFGRENLLRVDSRLTAAGRTLDSVIWCDTEGTIRSYHTPQGNITAHRTVKNLALAKNDKVDLYKALNIRVLNPIPEPHKTRYAIYQARLRNGNDPFKVFPTDHSQRVTSLNADEVQIEVIAIRPDLPALEETPQSPPIPADVAPNALIQSDHPDVRALLSEVQTDSDDPFQWALACEAFVAQAIENKVLTEAFATSAEVALSRTGDCTEHAVLTAALCRARGIPARVATGLIAYQNIYAFHMWNEVWVGDRWIPIDATLGRGGIGAGHIKLSVSNLDGVSPFAALAPVLDVMGTLELKVVSFE